VNRILDTVTTSAFQQTVAMSVVSLSYIVSFFENELKLISRGENAVKSGRVEQFLCEGSVEVICGKIRSSLTDVVYAVTVGLLTVSHTAGLMLRLLRVHTIRL